MWSIFACHGTNHLLRSELFSLHQSIAQAKGVFRKCDLKSCWINLMENNVFNRIVSCRSRRCRLSPLYRLLGNYWITVLYKLFVTVTTVSSSGEIKFIVIINILAMRTFNYISVITINWTWVNNIWWQTVPQVKLIILSLCKKYFAYDITGAW